jgi:hypothetical protein
MENEPKPGWGEGHEEQIARLNEEIEAGRVPTYDCAEARAEWFTMARNQYVENNPEPRVAQDYAIGVHLGTCATEACRTLGIVYMTVLRTSSPETSVQLSSFLDQLESRVRDLGDKRAE